MVNAIYQHNYITENVIPVRPRINSIGTETLSWSQSTVLSPIQTVSTLQLPAKKECDKNKWPVIPTSSFQKTINRTHMKEISISIMNITVLNISKVKRISEHCFLCHRGENHRENKSKLQTLISLASILPMNFIYEFRSS